MDVSLRGQTLSVYLVEYIWGKILNDMQNRIEERIHDQNKVMEIENEFREYIKNTVDVEVRKTQENIQGVTQINVTQIFNDCYEVLFDENK
jgi:uncharacterized protein YaaW (UPF0174 family)